MPRVKSGKSTMPANGDCYEAAGKFMISKSHEGGDNEYILVHGEVLGRGPLEGVTFGHAWVLDVGADMVIDNSNGGNRKIPKMVYYVLGHIEHIGNYHEYTAEQALEKMKKFKHYGPWDLRTSSGL